MVEASSRVSTFERESTCLGASWVTSEKRAPCNLSNTIEILKHTMKEEYYLGLCVYKETIPIAHTSLGPPESGYGPCQT